MMTGEDEPNEAERLKPRDGGEIVAEAAIGSDHDRDKMAARKRLRQSGTRASR
jgi:hypothetical protein